MTPILYPRERQVLAFISQFIQRFGHAPTLKEMCEALGLSSVATIHEHIEHLRQKGYIEKIDGVKRGLEIIKGTFRSDADQAAVELPVLGYIAAGQPLEPYTDPNLYITVAPTMVSSQRPAYVLQVKGDSMIEAGIYDRDYVVVEQTENARDGEVVVALLENGFATLKRYFKEATRVRLEPANSTMSPIFVTKVRIQGKVVGVIRKFGAMN